MVDKYLKAEDCSSVRFFSFKEITQQILLQKNVVERYNNKNEKKKK